MHLVQSWVKISSAVYHHLSIPQKVIHSGKLIQQKDNDNDKDKDNDNDKELAVYHLNISQIEKEMILSGWSHKKTKTMKNTMTMTMTMTLTMTMKKRQRQWQWHYWNPQWAGWRLAWGQWLKDNDKDNDNDNDKMTADSRLFCKTLSPFLKLGNLLMIWSSLSHNLTLSSKHHFKSTIQCYQCPNSTAVLNLMLKHTCQILPFYQVETGDSTQKVMCYDLKVWRSKNTCSVLECIFEHSWNHWFAKESAKIIKLSHRATVPQALGHELSQNPTYFWGLKLICQWQYVIGWVGRYQYVWLKI